MTPDRLRELIAGGETFDVEFKGEERAPLNDRDLVEAATCLANRIGTNPGWLVIGVENDGRVTGARPRHENSTDVHRLAALVASRTKPALPVLVHAVLLGAVTILVVEVPPQRQPICTSEGIFPRRTLGGDGKPACVPMDGYALQSLQADRGILDPSAQVVPAAQWSDLDLLEFERFRRSVRERRGRSDESLIDLPDLDLAKALGAVEANGVVRGIRLAALLLFGKEEALRRYVPSHEAAFQVLHDLDIEVNDFFRWPLLRIVEEFETRIRARNREQELMVGMLRVGIPDYSERALREALANALIHRDYQRLGAVSFQWHRDHIEVISPGGFPEGVRLDNLLVTAPRPRNLTLADAFKRAGIVDRTARGVDTIFFEQLRNGRPAPSYERSDSTSVVVVIPGGEANLEFVRLLVTEGQRDRPLSLDELLVLNALEHERSVTTLSVARLIQKSESVAGGVLHRLMDVGLVEEHGRARGRTWRLSAAAYRALGDKVGYVRQRGFEPLQQEQMVLQFVEKHGRITRTEAAELCRISSDQAFRLLNRLVRNQQLRRGGASKGTWYEREQSI